MANLIPTIGLEIHVQLDTKSKMFCRCDNNAEGKAPNTVVCPVCMGFPGTLPVANAQAIAWGAQAALALGCTINKFQRFDRKNYFYPDLPKGYQISQFFFPAGEHGQITIDYLPETGQDRAEFAVRIKRVHLEEDAGKLVHAKDGILVDFNRCGTPLLEIVTEPDMHNPREARAFMQELQRIVRALGVSLADMEKGHLRVDANISMAEAGSETLGTLVELKNMNSFRFVEKALAYEVVRQTEAITLGQSISKETRGWDEKINMTLSQRSKEEFNDYRYFPEPDLPPIVLTDAQIEEWRFKLVNLPAQLRQIALAKGLPYSRVVELQEAGHLFKLIKLIENDPKLVKRICAAVLEVKIGESPKFIKERLENAGIRSLNNLVDVTNYLMREIGHPAHVFDFDKLGGKIKITASQGGELIETLDDKKHRLFAGDIIAVNEKGEVVDLLGIMGLKNSVVSDNTKRILLFLDNNDPARIRKTSMNQAIRTEAAVLNEKGVDPNLALDALYRGIELYEKYASGLVISETVDIYEEKPKTNRNDGNKNAAPVSIYGIDLYGMKASLEALINYLNQVYSAAARRARRRFQCLENFINPYFSDGLPSEFNLNPSCTQDAAMQLCELRHNADEYIKKEHPDTADA